MILIKQFQIVA